MRVMNYNKIRFDKLKVKPEHMIDLLQLIQNKEITDTTAQKMIEKLVEEPFDVKKYVKDNDLKVVADKGELENFCKEAIKESPKAVEDYKAGSEKSLNFVVGKVMQKTKGKADPKVVLELLKKLVK